MTPATDAKQIEAVLFAHRPRTEVSGLDHGCTCNEWRYDRIVGQTHRAHVAAQVAAIAGDGPSERLCSQCGERMSCMVKVGTEDGWCEVCLDQAAAGTVLAPFYALAAEHWDWKAGATLARRLRALLDDSAAVTSVESGCTCGGLAACEQCQDRDALRALLSDPASPSKEERA